MKKGFVLVLALLMLLPTALLTGCAPKTNGGDNAGGTSASPSADAPKAGGELNLFTWEAMFPQEVLDAFTQETGIKINYNNFDYDETMLSKLEASKGGDYDLVIADDYIIKTAIEEGLVQKLDTSKLSNYGNINPVYQGQFYDPDNAYTVPYGAGVQTIVYNPETVKLDIKGYSDLFDPSLKDSVGIIDSFRVIDGLALKILGESYNTTDLGKLDAAGKKLLELAPNIRLIKDDKLEEDLLSGEISAAVMYTSQVTTAMMTNPGLKMVFPKEGIGFGIMANFIPVNAPHPDAAYAFMDYILRPDVSAKCFEYLGYYCTNKAADDLINPDYKPFLTLPKDLSTGSMEMIQPISPEAEEEHTKIWTAFKSAAGQ
jgi:spermidine/putrescine transport system substrate-binding protein